MFSTESSGLFAQDFTPASLRLNNAVTILSQIKELLSNLVFETCGHAAIWLGLMASIPSLNVTPVMTFA
jgi:hypothetical protein